MNKNQTENKEEVKDNQALTEATINSTVARINKVLEEDGMILQSVLEGMPFRIIPVIRVIPKPVEKDETEEAAKS